MKVWLKERVVPAEPVGSDSDVDDFPIPIVPDWNEQVARANEMAEVIDRHLWWESMLQKVELRPGTLCPEQKVNLVTDITGVMEAT